MVYGAFLLALLVSVIALGFTLEENKMNMLTDLGRKKKAATLVKCALKYNVTISRRHRTEEEEKPTIEEVVQARGRMDRAIRYYKDEKQEMAYVDENVRRD
jgi:hypothetical protein